jgi:hypothetical protein
MGPAMPIIAFHSSDPLDHVCRALDAVRKMGFQLASLHVEDETEGGFRVCMVVKAHDHLSLETLLARLSSCIGVLGMTCDVDSGAMRPAPFPRRA